AWCLAERVDAVVGGHRLGHRLGGAAGEPGRIDRLAFSTVATDTVGLDVCRRTQCGQLARLHGGTHGTGRGVLRSAAGLACLCAALVVVTSAERGASAP